MLPAAARALGAVNQTASLTEIAGILAGLETEATR